jgi:hypothetical protein
MVTSLVGSGRPRQTFFNMGLASRVVVLWYLQCSLVNLGGLSDHDRSCSLACKCCSEVDSVALSFEGYHEVVVDREDPVW